jgi:hypothetical protein
MPLTPSSSASRTALGNEAASWAIVKSVVFTSKMQI